MNNKPVINRALIADGLLFNTPGDRCRYLGKWSWEKPRWLRENAGKYRRLEDGEQQSAALCSSIENDENGAPPTRSNSETSSPAVRKGGDNDNDFSSIGTPPQDRSHPSQPASLSLPWNENVPSGSTQTELLPRAKPAASETTGPKPETAPRPGRKRARSGSRQVRKQKTSAGISKTARKISPELMQVVLDSLRECPILSRAANKAGIHRKRLEYWIRRSEAGDDGYDIEREGVTRRFHERCKSAIDGAHDDLLGAAWQIAFGGTVYKNDPSRLDLGCQGSDAYARDENGDFIIVAVLPPNMKMFRFLLKRRLAEKYGENRKIDVPQTGGVLVIGMPQKPGNKPKPNTAASVNARKWKALSRRAREAKD